MKKETLIYLTKQYDGTDGETLGDYIRRHVSIHSHLKHEIEQHNEAERAMASRHTNERGEYHQHFKLLQERCTHYETTYHPDASGNNDSWTSCDLCGKDL